MTLDAGYGWESRRPVGSEIADAMAMVEIGAARGVVVERVRARFDGGVRTIATRFSPPDRGTGVAIVDEWPVVTDGHRWPSIPARGAHLTKTGEDGSWLLMLGYQITEPGRHLRPTITIDYRVGNEHFSVTSETPALICSGRALRNRRCDLPEGQRDGEPRMALN